jgi:hypothetical protein
MKGGSDAILSLEPIWYRSTAPADRPDWSWYGLIAEDVAGIEPRLVHYGYREDDYDLVPDDDGDGHRRVLKEHATLKPDGVQYDRLAVLLLDVVKRQEARLAVLEARLLVQRRCGEQTARCRPWQPHAAPATTRRIDRTNGSVELPEPMVLRIPSPGAV